MHINWFGLIPILSGTFAYLQGIGALKSKKHAEWSEVHLAKNGSKLRVAGPIIAAFGILYFFGILGGASSAPTIQQILNSQVVTINQKCPFVINENTTIMSAAIESPNLLSPNYSLVMNYKFTKLDNSQIDIPAFIKEYKIGIINNYKNNPANDVLRKNQVNFIGVYMDKYNHRFASISVSPKDL